MSKVHLYINTKTLSWSPTTRRNATFSLSSYEAEIAEGSPVALYRVAKSRGLSASSIGTLFTVASGFYFFLNAGAKDCPFKAWRKDNRLAFRPEPTKKVGVTYEEVKEAISSQKACWQKEACLLILSGALRSCEAGYGRYGFEGGLSRGGSLRGKGGKYRSSLVDAGSCGSSSTGSYHGLYRWLRQVAGVSPHALRKLALSRAAERGATAADLCKIAGWSSISTAFVYLQPKQDERLRDFLAD